jgi:hypothetical protein
MFWYGFLTGLTAGIIQTVIGFAVLVVKAANKNNDKESR